MIFPRETRLMRFSTTTLSLAGCALLALALLGSGAAAQNSDAGGEVDWEKQPYIIKDGKVDYGTYNGYRPYHSYCPTCHGPDEIGRASCRERWGQDVKIPV